MSIDEFFVKGLRDAERRIPFLRPIRPEEQQALLTVVCSSQIFRVIDRVVDRLTRACDTSVVLQGVRRMWSGTSPAQKRLIAGVALIVAATVHVTLVVWHETPPSWLWLVVPGFTVAIGLLFVIFSGAERRAHV